MQTRYSAKDCNLVYVINSQKSTVKQTAKLENGQKIKKDILLKKRHKGK